MNIIKWLFNLLFPSKKSRNKRYRKPNYGYYIHSKEWYSKLPKFHNNLMHRDCLIPLFKANDIHHLTYDHLGKEAFIIDVVPLCKFTHWFADRLRWFPPFNMLLRVSCLFWTIAFIPLHILRPFLKLCR
jgi:hypothetical protein